MKVRSLVTQFFPALNGEDCRTAVTSLVSAAVFRNVNVKLTTMTQTLEHVEAGFLYAK